MTYKILPLVLQTLKTSHIHRHSLGDKLRFRNCDPMADYRRLFGQIVQPTCSAGFKYCASQCLRDWNPLIFPASFPPSRRFLHFWKQSYTSPRAMATSRRRKTSSEESVGSRQLSEEERAIVTKFERRLDICQKESTKQLRKRLDFSTNILGIQQGSRNGSIKEGTVNAQALALKRRFPDEIVLIQVGEFYETVGFDALLLVEYANLNPMGGLTSDSVPRAGFPLRNLRQTLGDLSRHGLSACVVKEVTGPTKSNERKDRFLSGHSHPGSPYIYGHSREEGAMDEFPVEQVPVVGLGRSSRGYTLISVYQLVQLYKLEEGLTEEAALAKLRTAVPLRGFLHRSLKHDITGVSRWGAHGEGGRLYGECAGRDFDWYDGDPLQQLLCKVREMFDLSPSEEFRSMESPPGDRPRPLYTSAACQIGIVESVGVPSLPHTLLPDSADKLCHVYLKELLLNPPPLPVALAIQEVCSWLSSTTLPLPDFHCQPGSKLVKLLRAREVNHGDLVILRQICLHILACQPLAHLVLLPTWLSTGIHVQLTHLLADCQSVADLIDGVLEEEQEAAESHTSIPALHEIREALEASWRGRVKRCHVEEAYDRVDSAFQGLAMAVSNSFSPVVEWNRSKAGRGACRAEILYNREQDAIFLKGKNLRPSAEERSLGDIPGLREAALLEHALDRSRGRKRVGEEWWTAAQVDTAVEEYHLACAAAGDAVVAVLKQLAEDLQEKLDSIITAATMSVIANTLILHTERCALKGWSIPAVSHGSSSSSRRVDLKGVFPYWLDPREGSVVCNDVHLGSLALLTGPNGGGKSSVLRSVYATCLLANCGLLVPAREASVPHFDSFFLRMASSDSPADSKSSFQMEMCELATIMREASSHSLVLMDEICRGTEVQKGTAIVGAALESLSHCGCIGMVSTHLHGLLDAPLRAPSLLRLAMGAARDPAGHLLPTWKLLPGECRESLAFEVATKEGVPQELVQRAMDIYQAMYPSEGGTAVAVQQVGPPEAAKVEIERHVQDIFQDVFKSDGDCSLTVVMPNQLPPPGSSKHSHVYLMMFPNGRYYVGQTDNIIRRIRTHRLRKEARDAVVSYLVVGDKSRATLLETILIRRLRSKGVHLLNKGDEHHSFFGAAFDLT